MNAKHLILTCSLAIAVSAADAAHMYGHLDKPDKSRPPAATEALAPAIPRVVITATKEQARAAKAAAEPALVSDDSVKTRKIGRAK